MVQVEEIAKSIEKDLLERRIIVKHTYRDLDKNQDYYLISTPDVFKKIEAHIKAMQRGSKKKK